MESAQKLTTVITQIIEFAKMVPGFMSFPQDDQIVLLKGGTYGRPEEEEEEEEQEPPLARALASRQLSGNSLNPLIVHSCFRARDNPHEPLLRRQPNGRALPRQRHAAHGGLHDDGGHHRNGARQPDLRLCKVPRRNATLRGESECTGFSSLINRLDSAFPTSGLFGAVLRLHPAAG